MEIPDSIHALVATGPLAHLTTLNADGSPHIAVVWIGIEGGEFVCAHMSMKRKIRNMERDPRVALSLLGHGTNTMGLREYLVVYGAARITEGGAAALLQRLARIYLGPDVVFPPASSQDQPGYVTRIRPERFAGVGPWNSGQQ